MNSLRCRTIGLFALAHSLARCRDASSVSIWTRPQSILWPHLGRYQPLKAAPKKRAIVDGEVQPLERVCASSGSTSTLSPAKPRARRQRD